MHRARLARIVHSAPAAPRCIAANKRELCGLTVVLIVGGALTVLLGCAGAPTVPPTPPSAAAPPAVKPPTAPPAIPVVVAAPEPPPAPARPAPTPAPEAGKVMLIGIDAADWRLIDPLIAAGQLPNLARLVSAGASGPLSTILPAHCPPVWNTIITGKPPRQHGITGISSRKQGRRLPTSGLDRKVRALWNMADESGRSAGVVGLWSTWPAEEINGFMVSSFNGLKAKPERFDKGVQLNELEQLSSQGTIFAAPELHQTWPEGIYGEIEPFVLTAETGMAQRIRGLLPLEDNYQGNEEWVEAIKWVFVSDAIYTDAATTLLRHGQPDFFAVYLRGLDTVGHRIARIGASPRAAKRYAGTLQKYYALVDGCVGRILAEADPGTRILVVSDHGVEADSSHGPTGPPGIVILSGPDIRPGKLTEPASVLDVTPTVLYLLGLPTARDMKGKVIPGALTPDYVKAHPERTIDTWESTPREAPKMSVADFDFGAEIKRRLERLGSRLKDEEL